MFSNSLSSTARIVTCGMRRFALAATVACAAMFASGCALLSDNLDKAAKGAGKVVTYYCENITIPEIREEVRAAVNKHAAPHSVAIECVDDLGRSVGPELKSAEPASVAPDDDADDDGGEPIAKASKPIVILEKWLKPIIFPERKA